MFKRFKNTREKNKIAGNSLFDMRSMLDLAYLTESC